MDNRKLRKSKDKIICGVCGGWGEYLDIDSTIVRLIFIVMTLAGFSGVLAYIVCALLMPEAE